MADVSGSSPLTSNIETIQCCFDTNIVYLMDVDFIKTFEVPEKNKNIFILRGLKTC
jgi:hypothetical protein